MSNHWPHNLEMGSAEKSRPEDKGAFSSLEFLGQLEDGLRQSYQIGLVTKGNILHQEVLDWGGRSLVEGGNVGELLYSML